MLVLMLLLRSSFVMEVMVLDIAMSIVRPVAQPKSMRITVIQIWKAYYTHLL